MASNPADTLRYCTSYLSGPKLRVLRSSFSLLGALGRLALVVYVILGVAFLGVRYLVLPNLNHWNQQIAQLVSGAVGMQVQLGQIQAQWYGLNPSFQVADVRLFDQSGRQALVAPAVQGELSWRSVFALSPQFVSLRIDNVRLDVSHDAQGAVHLLGQSFTPGQPDPVQAGKAGLLSWLLQQQRMVFRNASLSWSGPDAKDPPFELANVTLDLLNRGAVHRLVLKATPPAQAGESLDARIELAKMQFGQQGISLKGSQGRAYVNVQGLRPKGWPAFMPPGFTAPSGRFSATAWVELADGAPSRVAAKFGAQGARWTPSQSLDLRFQTLDAFVSGAWGDMRAWLDAQATAPPPHDTTLDYQFSMTGLRVAMHDVLRSPIDLDRISAQGRVDQTASGRSHVVANTLALANADIQATLSASWTSAPDAGAGLVDVHGKVHTARVSAIKDYLPLSVDPDAVAWMQTGLLDGTIVDAGMKLQGDLAYFPFQERPDKGDFLIRGRHQDTVIDYVPADHTGPGWPKLLGMRGQVSLHRADLRLTADTAYMESAPDQRIELENVQARIPNIEDQAVLWVKGTTQAPAPAYLALMHNSPLGELLDNAVSDASGQGLWQVPLELTVPLYDTDASTVHGRVIFTDGQVMLRAGVPELTAVNGALEFTETYLKAADLKAQVLGGDVRVEGGLGQGLEGLVFSGKASADALKTFLGLTQLRQLKGSLDYSLSLRRADNGYVIAGSSDLKGITLDFPSPLGKDESERLALKASWEPFGSRARRLKVSLGPNVSLLLQHREGAKGSYFNAGTLGVNQSPAMAASGFVLDVEQQNLDLDAWKLMLDQLAQSAPKTGKHTGILPDLAQIRLQSRNAVFLGLPFEHFTLSARQTPDAQWRIDVSSSETAGTVFLRESRGKQAGSIDAKFDRLALGRATAAETTNASVADDTLAEALDVQDSLDIPAINLYAKNLSLYGHPVGELTVTGRNQSRGKLWKLDELKIASAAASFTGSGLWRLSGASRGLSLSLKADVADMGAYLAQIGHKDVMAEGAGTVTADIEWRNMPWAFSRADLNGKLTFNLAKGRFSSVNSHTARLLELLSMQSVRRLARFDLNPGELTRQGFPFDNLAGQVSLTKGVMSTRDYRVTGPVATIVLEGDVNLVSESLNLDALVVPNLDVSGAAVAAGIAINPIVGIGAFLTQWLLQAPLSKAMSVQYHVDGPWDKPQIREVSVRQPKADEPKANPNQK